MSAYWGCYFWAFLTLKYFYFNFKILLLLLLSLLSVIISFPSNNILFHKVLKIVKLIILAFMWLMMYIGISGFTIQISAPQWWITDFPTSMEHSNKISKYLRWPFLDQHYAWWLVMSWHSVFRPHRLSATSPQTVSLHWGQWNTTDPSEDPDTPEHDILTWFG